MTYDEAKKTCAVRSGIFRESDPERIFTEKDRESLAFPELGYERVGLMVPKVFWKNIKGGIDSQVPISDRVGNDWMEYDPRESGIQPSVY